MIARERISQTDALVEKLKHLFASNRMAIGDKLPPEQALCTNFAVGRSTVREAVRALQVMGYVEIQPGRGAFLIAKRLDEVDAKMAAWIRANKPDLEETVRIRESLESLAIRLAVEKVDDAGLAAVDRARTAFEDALRARDFAALASLDEAFHNAIVAASGCELLIAMNSMAGMAFREWRKRSFRVRSHAANAVMPHQKIASAIMSRDAELAELQLRRHMENILADMRGGVDATEGK